MATQLCDVAKHIKVMSYISGIHHVIISLGLFRVIRTANDNSCVGGLGTRLATLHCLQVCMWRGNVYNCQCL